MKNQSGLPDDSSLDEQLAENLAQQLSAILSELVTANLLTEQVKRILSLRMGLEDGKCRTLSEVANILNKSPEWIRSRQYLALKKHTKNPRVFRLLRDYACLVRLPKGVTFYLDRYSSDPENLPY